MNALFLAKVLWLALPVTVACVAHMAIVKGNRLASWSVPLDGGRCLRGRRLLGATKTWRGVAVVITGTVLVGAAQGAAFGPSAASLWFEPIGPAEGPLACAWRYAAANTVIGAGYVLGELPNSFLKRRLGIEAGGSGAGVAGIAFRLLDRCDGALCGVALCPATSELPWSDALAAVVVLAAVHGAVTWLLYRCRVKAAF